jgi:hypothetical protein
VPRFCEQTATAVRTVHADWGQPASVMPHLAVDMPRLSAPSAGRTAASEPESIFWRNSPNKARSLRGEGYADWKTTLRLLLPDMERWTASAIPETRREMLRWLRLADSPVCAVRFKRRLCYPKARVEPPQPVQAEPALLGPDAVPPGVSTLAPPKLSGPVPIASDYTESTDWFLTLAYESEKDSAA